ncbi:MHS family MFS transporter [Pseudoclavibacter chungangensis]|uniref:MHS family MFS transporter n=1 Tax=Pseudoclavibacter chungangensis TaxID=587635 RepID=A0A7J5BQP0_9MICO|nr:MFS transporter [Pseudoclavibacter chungangensis]KAB1656327.1 MHS family MFS transporter [Pseudoclavibacter chungangensis]NYJ67094.1 MHS family proline/betaine transporter-like MFS transporter [Pseudoclavibacter chungangensis]
MTAPATSAAATKQPPSKRRILVAGCIGIFVELYDNGIFAFMASTLAIVFFPAGDETGALVFVFAGYAVSFFVRPLGAVIFGVLGDRFGRQRMLVAVIMLISVATAGIGLLPPYAVIGVAAPVLLVLFRMLQGLSVGGEAAGAMTFLAEHSAPNRRGLNTSLAQVASFAALLTGTLVAFGMSPWLTADAIGAGGFGAWAWRIPFLVAVPLGLVGFYIRKSLDDTPNFKKLQEEDRLSRNPIKEAFSTPEHRKAMLLALFVPLMNGAGYYVIFSYMPTFLKSDAIGFSIGTALIVTATSLVAICIAVPIAGAMSDRFGRKRIMAWAAVLMAVIAIPAYALIITGELGLAILGACLMAVVFAGHTAVIHIMIVELFPTRIRYSAYGLGYNISSALFGGTAPLLMTWLIGLTHNSFMPAYYVVLTSIGTLVAVLTVTDRAHEPLRDE